MQSEFLEYLVLTIVSYLSGIKMIMVMILLAGNLIEVNLSNTTNNFEYYSDKCLPKQHQVISTNENSIIITIWFELFKVNL